MNIGDLMTKNVELTHPDTSIRDAATRMREDDVGALPVGEDDRLVGMVTDRDIAVRAVADGKVPDDCSVREVMSEGIYYCFEDDDAGRASEVMAEHKVRRLPVLDRNKRLVGVIAIADLARVGIADWAVQSVSESTQQARQ